MTVGVVVLVSVGTGGMRSITLVQAVQYWLKLTALLVPAAVLLVVWLGDGSPGPAGGGAAGGGSWSLPLAEGGSQGLYSTYSLVVATFLGTMGLPHVVVRFYTNPDGRAARRTTLVVLGLLGLFYVLPPVYAALGRVYGAAPARADSLVLDLPRLMMPGLGGELLTGLVTAGAYAAFLSTSSGLTVAVAGVLTQDLTARARRGRRLPDAAAFRLAVLVAVVVPLAWALALPDLGVARAVGLAFSVAASTFCPLLVLGIWWAGLTAPGAVAGLVTGGLGSATAVAWTLFAGTTPDPEPDGWAATLLGQPAAWSVPLAFATMVLVSLATASRRPTHARRFLVRLHTPEALGADRG